MLAFVFILFLGWFIVGFFVYFGVSGKLISQNALNQIKSPTKGHQFKTFFLDRSEMEGLVWLKHKEFKYQGDHYDVEEITWLEKDSVKMVCYKDTPETKFFNRMKRMMSKKSDENRQSQSSPVWTNLLNTPLILSKFNFYLENINSLESKTDLPLYVEKLTHTDLTISSPPPEAFA